MGNLGVNEEYYHGNLTLPHLFAKAGEFFDTIRKSSVKAHIWNTLVPEISNNLGRLAYYSTRGMSQILQSCLQRDTPTQRTRHLVQSQQSDCTMSFFLLLEIAEHPAAHHSLNTPLFHIVK
jgi:hypothetical protein